MTHLDPQQRAAIEAELANISPASPELLQRCVLDALRITRSPNRATLPRYALDLGAAAPSVLRRLLDAEAELATVRGTVARVIHAANDGDDYSMSDLAWELETAGVSVQSELDDIEAIRNAEARAATFA